MRKNVRAVIGAAIALATVVGASSAAVADGHGYPTKHQVDHAKHEVAAKQGDLASVRARLARTQRSANAAEQRAEIASENYNGALWRLSLAKKAAAKADAAAKAAHQQVASQRADIAQLVVASYQDGSQLSTMSALLSADGPTGVMNRTSVVNMAGSSMQAHYNSYVAASQAADRADLAAAAAAAKQQRVADKAASDRAAAASSAHEAMNLVHTVSAERNQVVDALARAEHTSITLARQRQAALEAIARRRAEAAARRRAEEAAKRAREEQQQHNSGGGSQGGGTPAPPVATGGGITSRDVAAAIDYAKAQIGKPYQWAAAGPYTFDCSGLTMMAWRQGGIYLPHYSVAQYDAGTPVSIADARPGDLIFFSHNGAPSGIHHVALYLGNGEFIEAPHTGADVRYNSIYDEYPNFAVRL